MHHDPVLDRLAKDLAAKTSAKLRVKRRVFHRIQEQESFPVFSLLQSDIVPPSDIQKAIWERVYARITSPQAANTLERLRAFLTPSFNLREHLGQRIVFQLAPVQRETLWSYFWLMKFTAAFALLALLVRMSPFLFIAAPTVAESAVTFLPTRGEVLVSVGGLWQPVHSEITLEPGMMLRTHNGEASILFHDDGVVRLDANTTIQLHDTADRSEPAAPDVLPTLTLFTGRLWVQGLIPSQMRGLTVSTSFGYVTINEGSVSITEDAIVDVIVFNRRAIVAHDASEIVLIAGERTQMWDGNVPLVKKVADAQYEEFWSHQNLARDAVHRREIAQLQQERRAAKAGILPTSRLYSMKRVAETVDVLLTFTDEARTQKRIEQSERRLNEAAALIVGNQNQNAKRHLEEYRDLLQQLARETEGGSLTDFLLQQSLAATSAAVAAVQPEDDGYLIKLAVLEASTELDSAKSSLELEAVLLMDALASLNRLLEEDSVEKARAEWLNVTSSLTILENEQLPVDVQKEVVALLGRFALLSQEHAQEFEGIDAEFTAQVAQYLPVQGSGQSVSLLNEEELQNLVKSIRARIFVYHMQRSRLNQLVTELRALSGHPEEGRILRRLYSELPGGPENFPERIEKEITRLRWEKAGDTI